MEQLRITKFLVSGGLKPVPFAARKVYTRNYLVIRRSGPLLEAILCFLYTIAITSCLGIAALLA